ncbi:unnamed protein product, partial [Rotaria socialis]
ACFHAQLMTSRPYFQQSAQLLETLSSEDVATALLNISKASYSKVSDERINTLMKHIKSRSSEPFVTINPADIHSPVAVYFGTVESQDRGSLHLHLLIWLKHEYTPAQLKENIQNQDFRDDLLKYLEDVVKEDLDLFRDEANDGTSTTSDISVSIQETGPITDEVVPACLSTPNPDSGDFHRIFCKDNMIASQQEVSGVQVASYLMNYDDHYTTHTFRNLFLISIENYLQAELSKARLQEKDIDEERLEDMTTHFDEEQEEDTKQTEEQFLLEPTQTKNDARFVMVNTSPDYQYRSQDLTALCLYDFVSHFHKKLIDKSDRHLIKNANGSEGERLDTEGTKMNERYTFESAHPQASSHIVMK